NRTYLEYLEEQVRIIDADLQPCLTAFFSKERIIYLEKEKEYFLAEIHEVK
ncbi:9414_t:CDS:1, partial [Gigaspora margarita]